MMRFDIFSSCVFIIITLTICVFICSDFYDLKLFLSVPYFNIFSISEFFFLFNHL